VQPGRLGSLTPTAILSRVAGRAARIAKPHAHLAVSGQPPVDGRRRRTPSGPTFREAAEVFVKEYTVITLGERNPRDVIQKSDQIRVHLNPFFGDVPVADITAGDIQEYRVHRQAPKENPETGTVRRPARSTLHGETVTLRRILKTANRMGWISAMPDMSVAYKSSGKISHRAWFSQAEYKQLYEATRERAKNPKKERWRGRVSSCTISCSSWEIPVYGRTKLNAFKHAI